MLRKDLGIEVGWLKVELRMLGLLKAKEGLVGATKGGKKKLARGFEDLVVRERTKRGVSTSIGKKKKTDIEGWGLWQTTYGSLPL